MLTMERSFIAHSHKETHSTIAARLGKGVNMKSVMAFIKESQDGALNNNNNNNNIIS